MISQFLSQNRHDLKKKVSVRTNALSIKILRTKTAKFDVFEKFFSKIFRDTPGDLSQHTSVPRHTG